MAISSSNNKDKHQTALEFAITITFAQHYSTQDLKDLLLTKRSSS